LFDVRSTVWLFLCVVVKRTLWRFAFGPNDGGTLENFDKFFTVCKFIRRVDIVQLLASFPSSFRILGLFVDKQNIFFSLAFWTVFSLFFVSVCQSFNLFKVLRLRNRDWMNSLLQFWFLFLIIAEQPTSFCDIRLSQKLVYLLELYLLPRHFGER